MTYQSHYFQEAREAQSRAYVPYSNFKVGAYLKTKDGRTFYGANVENDLPCYHLCLNVLV